MLMIPLARSIATSAQPLKYKLVVVGGGSAGMAVAAQLSNSKHFNAKQQILIVDPAKTHYYQPLWVEQI
jgi:NADH dehydrogenase FAD-containing subunit